MSFKENTFDTIAVIRDKISQINGQKIFRDPPEFWVGEDPTRDCEIFVGRIPRDCSLEKELVPLFQQAGHLFEFRLMVQFSGCNRGYGFAMYTSVEDAQRAVIKFNNFIIRPTWQLGVCSSDNNCRLFMKRVPYVVSSLEVSKLIYENSDDVIEVYLKRGSHTLSLVTEYTNHRAAALARKTLVPLVAARWGASVQVDWSKPDWYLDFTQYLEVGHRIQNQVLILGIDKVKLRSNFSCGRAGSGSRSSYRRNKMIREAAQSARSSSAEDPMPGHFSNSNVKDLSGMMLRYCVDQPPPHDCGDDITKGGGMYRAILADTAARDTLSLDRSPSDLHQKLTNPASIRHRANVRPLDFTSMNTAYGDVNSNSPMVGSSQSSSSSGGFARNQYFNHSQMSNMMDYDSLGNVKSQYSPFVSSASPISPWYGQLTPQSTSSPCMFRYPSSSNAARTSSQSLSEGFVPDPSSSNPHEPIFNFSQSPKVVIPSRSTSQMKKIMRQPSSEHGMDADRSSRDAWNAAESDSFGVQSLLKNSGLQEAASVSPVRAHLTEDDLLEFLESKRGAASHTSKVYDLWGFSPKSDST